MDASEAIIPVLVGGDEPEEAPVSSISPYLAGQGSEPTDRAAVVVAHARDSTELNVSALWRGLAAGEVRHRDSFHTETRCYAVLECIDNRSRVAALREQIQVLARVLGASRQKNVALDATRAASTIALKARTALRAFGFDDSPSHLQPPLILAARSVAQGRFARAWRSFATSSNGRKLCVFSIERPDLCLASQLSSAEFSVIGRLLQGDSYRQIAAWRGTSVRTVANQICAVFRRLEVSGRNDLILRLTDTALNVEAGPAQTIIPEPLAPAPLAFARQVG